MPVNNTDVLMLSILTPTIPKRSDQFIELCAQIRNQIEYCKEVHPTLGSVEHIFYLSKPVVDGGHSIGEKRQALLEKAKGKYLCFLDDDDLVAPNYIEVLLRLCNEDRDVCTFRNFSKFDNYWCVVDMDINNDNQQTDPNDIIERKAWHICPVRSEFAKLYGFEDSNYGEDWVWFEKVLEHCKTQAKTNVVIHCYQHSSKTSEADKIIHG